LSAFGSTFLFGGGIGLGGPRRLWGASAASSTGTFSSWLTPVSFQTSHPEWDAFGSRPCSITWVTSLPPTASTASASRPSSGSSGTAPGVKLSGAYRLADTPYAEIIPLARALHAIAPDRCVWGSDWPHVAHWSHMPNVGDLLDLLADWVPDEAERREVLVGNPARLYGFSLCDGFRMPALH